MKISNFKKYIFLIPILVSSVIYYRWFSFKIFRHSDWVFNYSPTLKEFNHSITWVPNINFGYFNNVILWRKPIEFLYSVFGRLGFNSNIPDVFLMFLPLIIILPLSSYLITRKIFKSEIAAVFSSIFFSFNTYFLSIDTQGHLLLTIASGILVLSLYFLFFRDNTKSNIMWGLFFLCISGLYDFRFAYIGLFIIAFYSLFNLITGNKRGRLKHVLIPFFSGCIVVLFFGFWFLVIITTKGLSTSTAVSRNLFGDNFFNILYSLSLHHPFWINNYLYWFVNQPIQLYFWLLPILAFLGFLANKKRPDILFIFFITLVGVFLSKQSGSPFPSLYLQLYMHFPGFNAFREASKFYFLIAFGYSILIAGFINHILKQRSLSISRNYLKYIIIIILFIIPLWNTKPILTGEIGEMYIKRDIPNDYLIFKDFIINQPDYYRTFWIPTYSKWAINTFNHPQISDIDTIQSDWLSISNTEKEKANRSLPEQILGIINEPYSQFLLDTSSVKYIIVPLQDTLNDDDFFIYYGEKENSNIRNYYISELDKIPFLKKIDIGTKDLVIYENRNYKPYISTLTTLLNFSSLDNLDYKYDFAVNQLESNFDFVISTSTTDVPVENISNIFEEITSKNIIGNKILLDFNVIGSSTIYTTNSLKSIDQSANISTINIKQVRYNTTTNFKPLEVKSNKPIEYLNTSEFSNIIPDASFEDGPWEKQVADCNAYDRNSKISMKLDSKNKIDGNQSLELDATTHIACTNIKINVKQNTSYLFDFNYQSPNAVQVGYYIQFNNATNSVSEWLPIQDSKWDTLSKIIKTPKGATTATLFIYSYSKDNQTNIITRYDNFHLIELPDVINNYWLVSDPQTNFVQPKSVTFDLVNPTKKLVHITGATTPFYLSMSEAYHDQWQLEMNNSKIQGFLTKWIPWAHPDAISNSQHFKLDDFLNGWYVDVHDLCEVRHVAGCTQNADGSWNLEMVIEFWPQRWFYVGLIVSGTTLLGILGYLGYDVSKRIRLYYKNKTHERAD